MAYSNFVTFSDIKNSFQVVIDETTNLFLSVKGVEISDLLAETLKENIPLALAISTEKARSEMIVTPVLIEFRRVLNYRISLFSGIEFNVDREKGLNGVCDYVISLSREQFFISAPIVSIVEAKNDNIKSGLAQCIAEMLASKLFNEQAGNDIKVIYGIVTTGSLWKFIKLEAEVVYVDIEEYHIHEAKKIMGILQSMIPLD